MGAPSDFFKQYGLAIQKATEGTNLFSSVKAAQMALETGYGKNMVGNNAFGIKATGDGPSVNANTTEVVNGKSERDNLAFRAYDSVGNSIKDHTKFLQNNPRYTKAGVFSATTPEEQAQAIQRAGYATDPHYADKLISIINSNGLRSLDKRPTLAETIRPAVADETDIQKNTLNGLNNVRVRPPQPAATIRPATDGIDVGGLVQLGANPTLAKNSEFISSLFNLNK